MVVRISHQRFGRLLAIEPAKAPDGRRGWACACDCGGSVVVRTSALTSGNTTSCGCAMREAIAVTGRANATHGLSKTGEYRSWKAAIARCTNPKNNKFHAYGAVGITVCEKWMGSFEAFLADMGPKPSDKHTLDRFPNGAGNYGPGNCRWATASQQNLNRKFKERVAA